MNSPPYPNHSHKSSRGTDCWLQSNATAEYKVMPPPAAAQSTIYCHQIPSGRRHNRERSCQIKSRRIHIP
jgi:hypothetical protein